MKEESLKVIARELRLIRYWLVFIAICVGMFVFLPGLVVWAVGRIQAFPWTPFISTMMLAAVAVFVVLYIVNKTQTSSEKSESDSIANKKD